MNSHEKHCLHSVQDLILRDVRACDVQDYLFETCVLTLDDLTLLEGEKNPKKQIEMVIDWVKERPDAFQGFQDSLRDRHPYIIQEMERVQASASDYFTTSSQQSAPPSKNYVIEGDGNFVVADSENTRVHMKRQDAPAGQGPS